MLKIGEIRELIRLLDETSLFELKLETDDMKLLLKKADAAPVSVPVGPAPVATAAAPQPVVVQTPVVAPTSAPSEPAADSATAADVVEENVHIITSPMVGTFYRAPSPDAAPFVERGTKVGPKTVVCIVEAMKLMNEIEAEVTGEVVDILAENGQLVEYGQPLFKIKLS